MRPVDLIFPEADRENSIKNNLCIKPPFGCGKPVDVFRDSLSLREYKISGLCQKCQNKIFGKRNASHSN